MFEQILYIDFMFHLQENKFDSALIIFVKNACLGKVKSRLAISVGDRLALEVYQLLSHYTALVTHGLEMDKFVYYSDYIEREDCWTDAVFEKKRQANIDNLGVKMASAFQELYELSYAKMIIIGSDCLLLSEEILQEAMDELSQNQVVIGPSEDGGYYLMGINFEKINTNYKDVLFELFHHKSWSHAAVLEEAWMACEKMSLQYFLLPMLTDVDTFQDLQRSMDLLSQSESKHALLMTEKLMKLQDLWQ